MQHCIRPPSKSHSADNAEKMGFWMAKNKQGGLRVGCGNWVNPALKNGELFEMWLLLLKYTDMGERLRLEGILAQLQTCQSSVRSSTAGVRGQLWPEVMGKLSISGR